MTTVHNQGAIIAAEELSNIFDPFKRGRRAAAAGTGLGLFIVNEIVEDVGGEIDVASDDSGTTFTVVLPNRPPSVRPVSASP